MIEKYDYEKNSCYLYGPHRSALPNILQQQPEQPFRQRARRDAKCKRYA